LRREDHVKNYRRCQRRLICRDYGRDRTSARFLSRGYAAVVDAANQEGKLVVYSTTDSAVAAQLLRDFAALYPRIAVDYFELNSGEIYKRYLGEIAAGVDTADVLWASSMDGQLKMAAEGHAAT
jgi:iron(III) transport system substrate-binding protein